MACPVRIINPIGSTRFVNKNRAKRHILKGRARWVDPQTQTEIEFLVKPVERPGAHRPNLGQVTCDATPGRAVFPPWAGWDLRLISSNGSVVGA